MPIDYAALAAEHGGQAAAPSDVTLTMSSDPKPADGVDYAALAAEHGGAPVADFKQSDTSPNDVDPNTVGTALRHLWQAINPVQYGQLLPFPKAAGGSGMDHPLNPYKIAKDMHAVKRQADTLWAQGDHVGATAKYVESFVPLLGPWMSATGDSAQRGKWAAVLGDVAGLAVNTALPKAYEFAVANQYPLAATAAKAPRSSTPAPGPLTAADQASNAFARENGIPLDASTATGNDFVRGAQQISQKSIAGSVVGGRAKAARVGALTRVGGELADQVGPATTPETAGASITSTMQGLIDTLNQQAGESYGKLREVEADPQHARVVETAPNGSPAHQRIVAKLAEDSDGAHPPTAGELVALRAIARELEEQPYGKGAYIDDLETGDTRGGHYTQGAGAGSPIYHAVLDAAGDAYANAEGQGAVNMTRGKMKKGILQTLNTGEWTTAARMAYRLVQQKGAAAWEGSPYVDEQAPLVGSSERVAFPVEISPYKPALRPLYQSLKREGELAPLMGGKAEALRALDRVMQGPEVVPLSVADAALGDLKAIARGRGGEVIPTQGQGIVLKAVAQLSKAIDGAIEDASGVPGGGAVKALLEEGRSATKAKHGVAAVLEDVKAEPVRAYRQMVEPKDAGIEFLRQVQENAPQSMPAIGRAWLEERLGKATERGGFDHADRLYADWQNLGPSTKRILYGPELTSQLDRFFLLAKRMNLNVNPSGSGFTAIQGAELTAYVAAPLEALGYSATAGTIAALLNSRVGVAALTKALALEAPAPVRAAAGLKLVAPVSAAARRSAWLAVVASAKADGVALPRAADRDSTP